MNKIIFSMNKVGKIASNKKTILKDISLSFYYGAKIGILGSNGAGKSTLLRLIGGVDQDYLGEMSFAKGYSVGYLEQSPKFDPERTVKEVVQEGAQETVDMLKKFEDLSMKLAEPMSEEEMTAILEKQGALQDKLDACNAWDLDSQLELAMDSLCCPPPEAKMGILSGGECRRVALCRLLIQVPDILLLDEPTNHLDAETIYWLERHLKDYKGTIICITHDRYFLDNVAGWILELDRGHGIAYEGNYTSWLEQKTKRLAKEEKQQSKRQKALKDELEWIRSSQKARQSKSKARIKNYHEMVEKNQGEKRQDTQELFIPPGPRLGDLVIEAKNISKSYGDKLLYKNLSFKLPPGGVVGIIGPNGVGKSTLFRLITGMEEADSGTFKRGESVVISYVDQARDLNLDKSVLHEIVGDREMVKLGSREINSRAYVAKFNFNGDDHHKKVSMLSGGEKNRVHLAKLLQQEGNLLLMDEPTNDLDVHTLRALEEAIMSFAGCAVVISHDRYFLDRIATHILCFDGVGEATWFDGNYSEFEQMRKEKFGGENYHLKKLRYKKLKR